MEMQAELKLSNKISQRDKERFIDSQVETLALEFIEKTCSSSEDSIKLAADRSSQIVEHLRKENKTSSSSFKIISRALDIMIQRLALIQSLEAPPMSKEWHNAFAESDASHNQEKSADLPPDSLKNVALCVAESEDPNGNLQKRVDEILESKGYPLLHSVRTSQFRRGFIDGTISQEELLQRKESDITKLLEESGRVSSASGLKQEQIHHLRNNLESLDRLICDKTKLLTDAISQQEKAVLAKKNTEIELEKTIQQVALLQTETEGSAQEIKTLTEQLDSFKQVFSEGVSVAIDQVQDLKKTRKVVRNYDRVCRTVTFGKSWKTSYSRLNELCFQLENEYQSKRQQKQDDA